MRELRDGLGGFFLPIWDIFVYGGQGRGDKKGAQLLNEIWVVFLSEFE